MTQEEKQLLFQDLCARLPYGVKGLAYVFGEPCNINTNINGVINKSIVTDYESYMLELIKLSSEDITIKPYLRQMSSMTEEEKEEMHNLLSHEGTAIYKNDGIALPINHYGGFVPYEFMNRIIQYLLKNHFDFMGLIPKGLAIEVTDENNPYKE